MLLTSVAVLLSSCGGQSNEGPLNVVFFLVDDLGWRDVGSFGSDFHETPNIDRLASMGSRFTQAYAPPQVAQPPRRPILQANHRPP